MIYRGIVADQGSVRNINSRHTKNSGSKVCGSSWAIGDHETKGKWLTTIAECDRASRPDLLRGPLWWWRQFGRRSIARVGATTALQSTDATNGHVSITNHLATQTHS